MEILKLIGERCKESPAFAVFLGFLLFVFNSLVFIQLMLVLVGWMFGIDMDGVQEILSGNLTIHPDGDLIFRMIQAGNQLFTWGLTAVIMALILLPEQRVFQLSPFSGRLALLAPVIILASLPLVQVVHLDAESFQLPGFMEEWETWMRAREAETQEVLISLISSPDVGVLLANLFVFALVPAVCEELFFRGFLQHQFSRIMNPHLAIWLMALIFSIVHFQFYGFFSRLILGAMLGYFAYGARSLVPAIIAHFFFNGGSIIMMWVAINYQLIDPDTVTETYHFPMGWVIGSVCVTGILLFLYLRPSLSSNSPASI